MKYFLAASVVWLITIAVVGQEATGKKSLSLTVGPGYIARQDLIFSPSIHEDFSILNVGLDFTKSAKLFQKISLRYGNFNPMVSGPYEFTLEGETQTAYPHSFNFIDLDYLIGKQIKETGKSALTIGGLFSSDVQALSYIYGRISNFGYYSMLGLGVFGRQRFVMHDKSSLTTLLQIPVMAWLARSPYLVNDDEFIQNISSHSGLKTFMAFMADGRIVALNRLQTFDLEIKYAYVLNEKWELGAAYLFEFIHASQPRNLLSYRNSINLSANYCF